MLQKNNSAQFISYKCQGHDEAYGQHEAHNFGDECVPSRESKQGSEERGSYVAGGKYE
jgi:hypothetical protein